MSNTRNILNFLSGLQENNNRDWMQANRALFEEAKMDFQELVAEVLTGLASIDEGLIGLTPKDCIFRLNRDVRFSHDKRPYKNNFAAYFANGGKKSWAGGYYMHVQPGASFVGGGIYQPPADTLARIRQEIDYNPIPLHAILNNPAFKAYYGGMQGEKLKTSPKGYSSDHPDIELLRMKSFIVSRSFSDAEILGKDLPSAILKAFVLMKPLKDYLSFAIQE